ncbi:hypothetical protein [Lewinella sp. IMCC34183]|uniref:hypothetical protein n=1 Tax=Lewinella sp. IMCC34183 TaxID=2248762 RepID=UPI000E2495E4|nr:hypothetical protein [Lewinella sp. IMCC34183]
MRSIHLLTILLAVAGLGSCDCVISGEGYVYDAATRKPLVGATVKFLDTSESGRTDSTGFFDLYFVTGFCPDRVFQVAMPGYKPFELEVDGENDQTVYRVRTESYDVALDPPFRPDPEQPDSYIVSTSFDRFSGEFSVGKGGVISFYLERDDPAAELQEWKARMQSR